MWRILIAITCAALTAIPPAPQTRQVAITIDDVPRGGDGGPRTFDAVRAMTEKLLQPFRERKIPVIGFVNEGHTTELGEGGLRRVLDVWLDAGADLGNHTYSHPDINTAPLEQYTADIVRGEAVLRAALETRGRTLTFFRHPFLHAGPTTEIKRGLQTFLDTRGYRVAPVTLDNSDYQFAALFTRAEFRERVRRAYVPYMESVVAFFERRSIEVVGREFPQTLVIHASELNADLMPDLLAMFERRGYAFVSLETALKDDAYRLPETYAGRGGFSWVHRWSMTKGMPNKGEPDPPAWVTDARPTAR